MRPRPNVSALRRAVASSTLWRQEVPFYAPKKLKIKLTITEIAKERKALRDLRRHLAYHNALRAFVREVSALGIFPRDEKRNEQLRVALIKRAQILYP